MTDGKREKQLGLDMSFEEALRRFSGVDLNEMPDRIKLGRKNPRKKKGDGEPSPSKVDRKSRDPGR